MKKTISVAAVAAAAFGFGLAGAQPAQAAPNFTCDTAKLIVPWKPGGGTAI